jgi:hypothetical protein
MPSHLSDIGFQLNSEEDFRRLASQTREEGEVLEANSGTYIRWAAGEGIELWAQLDQNNDVIGLNPHFRGRGLMRVGIVEEILRPQGTPLDGAFYAWANPTQSDPDTGEFPFVFDVPDYQRHRVQLPSIRQVQLAAFAQELQSYESDEAFHQSQANGIKFASESFIPSGLFTPEGGDTVPPLAHAIFTGHVRDTSIITNPVTGNDFCWAQVSTLGGDVDVVADPALLNGLIVKGGVLSGSFWLSGVLIEELTA